MLCVTGRQFKMSQNVTYEQDFVVNLVYGVLEADNWV